MKSLLILLFLCYIASAAASDLFRVKLDLHVDHTSLDIEKAIRHQVVHSMGTGMNTKAKKRSSLNYNYSYEVIEQTQFENLTRTFYTLEIDMLVESLENLDNKKLVFPINPEMIFDEAQKYRHGCAKRGYRRKKDLFYWAWSPYLRGCGLKLNVDFLEIKPEILFKKESTKVHTTNEFLVDGKLHLFYYFGSDYFSTNRYGLAARGYSETFRKFKKLDFKVQRNFSGEREIFNGKKAKGKFSVQKGKINGVEAYAYILLGNPTDHTPKYKEEFFYFTKYALENGSSFNYSGHAGLGSVFNLDLLEEEYNAKIDYTRTSKQLLYIDGCNTFFYSSNFFFQKRNFNNSLVLVSNGLSILTSYYKQLVNTSIDAFIKGSFLDSDLTGATKKWMRSQGANRADYALVYTLSN